MEIQIEKQRQFPLKILLLFLFVYEFQINSLPSVFSSRRLILLFMFISAIKRNSSFKISKLKDAAVFWAFAIYSFFMFYINGGTGEQITGSLIYFGLYVFVLPLFFSEIFSSVEEFVSCFAWSGILQSIIVYLQYFFQPFREFLNTHFVESGNVSFLRIDRATGLGAEGATLGFFLSISMFSCAYMVYKNRNVSLYTSMYIIIFVASSLASRTGMIIGVAFASIVLVGLIKNGAMNIVKLLFAAIPTVYILTFLLLKCVTDARLLYMQNWLQNVFNKDEGSTINSLSSMEIPPITVLTILGNGIRRGTLSDGTIVQNYIGFVQSYVALGLIVAVFFYIKLCEIIVKRVSIVNDKTKRVFIYILLIVSFLLEFKEPFFLKYIVVFYIMMIVEISSKENQGGQYESKNISNRTSL